MKVYIEIVHVLGWRGSYWPADIPAREGWFVTCSECGRVTDPDWTYPQHAMALGVRTRHGNHKHAGRYT